MKNCPPLVFGPALAIDRMPALLWRSFGWNSSANVVAGPADALAERIAALNHEAVDHAVEDDAVVVRLRDLLVGARVGPLLGAFGQADEVVDRVRALPGRTGGR